jgi:hypothetical protein
MISFDTNVLVYATAAVADDRFKVGCLNSANADTRLIAIASSKGTASRVVTGRSD